MENPAVIQSVITSLAGLGGMLLGGLVVYHRVETMLTAVKDEIARVDKEQKDELKQVWRRFDQVQLKDVCVSEKKGCLIQFAVFKEGHEEIKHLFKELRGDIKAELRMLRECISAATAGKC